MSEQMMIDEGLADDVIAYAEDHAQRTGDPVTSRLLADVKERAETLERMRRENHDPRAIAEYAETSADEIELSHYNRVESALADLQGQAGELEKEFEADSLRRPEQKIIQEHRLEASIDAMDTHELEQTAERYISGEADLSYHALNVLSRNLKQAGTDMHQDLRQAMRDRKASEQWRRTPEGKRVGQALDFYSQMRGGKVAYTVDNDGTAQTYELRKILKR